MEFNLEVRSQNGKVYTNASDLLPEIKEGLKHYNYVVDAGEARIREIAALTPEQQKAYMDSAKDISKIALWEHQIEYYKEAYSKAINQ